LVYYWFDERGRKIANEYLAKWYLRADAVVMNRTDGALVRLVTQIDRGETEHDADLRLQAFIRDALPTLSEFLPSEVTSQTKITRFLGLKAHNFSVVGQWRS
jgi:EpsI family protein